MIISGHSETETETETATPSGLCYYCQLQRPHETDKPLTFVLHRTLHLHLHETPYALVTKRKKP